jgi:pseudaminic acid biosynthesis-associated methylase
MSYKTEQEAFWSGEFGDGYLNRNNDEQLVVSRMVHFGKFLRSAPQLGSIMELGCNVGMNLQALKRLNPAFELAAYEINPKAAQMARDLGVAEVTTGTVTEPIDAARTYDLTFTSGVLIHINPDALGDVYDNLYRLSNRYILINEYYNPTPVTVEYRGATDRLFKRDFAGELIDRYGLRLLDYGFLYRRDNYFPRDDSNWFLLEKQAHS